MGEVFREQAQEKDLKLVYFEPFWYPRVSDTFLLRDPPDGYRYVLKEGSVELLVRRSWTRYVSYLGYRWANRAFPLSLFKALIESVTSRPSSSVALTHAFFHLVFRREPWILEVPCEQPHLLIGTEYHFDLFRSIVLRSLASPYCKKIICRAGAVKGALLQKLGTNDVEGKVEVIYGATPVRQSNQKRDSDRIRLFFVNSTRHDVPWAFAGKGGLILLEAFRRLLSRYPHLELVIRSAVPGRILRDYADIMGSVRIIREQLPWRELENEWVRADIFVMPSFVTPDAVLIEAMSYGVPVVTTDIWANPEIVSDGRTGFLIPAPSSIAPFLDGYVIHFDDRAWLNYIYSVDQELVENLEEKLVLLIENDELRCRMSLEARREVEQGKFSLAKRKERLKAVYDNATWT